MTIYIVFKFPGRNPESGKPFRT